MIKRILLIALIIAPFCLQGRAYSQTDDAGYGQQSKDDSNQDTSAGQNLPFSQVRPGMEIKKVGGLNMVVPVGTQFYKEGAQIKMEEDGQYAARRITEMDAHLQKMDEKLIKLNEVMIKLAEEVEALRKAVETSRK